MISILNRILSSFTQTLTTLNIQENGIGEDGAKHLADVLKLNSVTTGIKSNLSSFEYFRFSHRNSQLLKLAIMESEMKEPSISLMPSKRT